MALRLVSGFLSWCATHSDYRELVQADAGKSKRIREKLGDAERRQVVLQKEELAAWFAAVREIPNVVISAGWRAAQDHAVNRITPVSAEILQMHERPLVLGLQLLLLG